MNYFNNEKILINFPKKSKESSLIALAFPNIYSIGMASLGYQNAWNLLNQNEEVKTIRHFTDIKEDSGKFNSSPDFMGFSFSWELDYKNIFQLLEENDIPLKSENRTEEHPLIFAGGQVINANPEPFLPNFDFFLIGDLEAIYEAFLIKVSEIKNLSRSEKLNELSKLDGIYIPNKAYSSSINKPVTKNELAFSSILSPDSYWADTFIVEVVRSCPELCRFCLASYGSLPFRKPALKESLIPIIDFGLKHTNKLGLLGASVTQHPEFELLLEYLLSKNENKKIHTQIASIRADTISKNLASGLNKLGIRSVTMAIESGSEKLRDILNKKVSTEVIFNSIQNIYDSGINSIKLYGMVGLPFEKDEDLSKTISLLEEIKKKNKGKNLSWGCSAFVPKAGTPFQIYGMDKNAEKKLNYLKKELHKIGVDLKGESYKWSLIQGLISRGDKTINPILEAAYRYGNTLGAFNKAIKEFKHINVNYFIYENWDVSTKDFSFPWHNIQGYLNNEIVMSHIKELTSNR